MRLIFAWFAVSKAPALKQVIREITPATIIWKTNIDEKINTYMYLVSLIMKYNRLATDR